MKKRLLSVFVYAILGLCASCGLYFLFRHFSAPHPLAFTLRSFGDFFVHFFDNFFFYPLGWVLKALCWLSGGSYLGAVILYTILAFLPLQYMRTKQDNLTFKMRLIQPEMDKIDEKYAAFDDEENQRRAQMEKMLLYKRHGIGGLGGCLLAPLLQFLVPFTSFILFCRFPHTPVLSANVQSELFGFDLFGRISGGPRQLVGFLSLAILYVFLYVFQNLVFGDFKKATKRKTLAKKRFTRISHIITTVTAPAFGVVSWLNDNGTFFFLPQDLMRIIGYIGLGSSLLLLLLGSVRFVLDHREAHRDELAHRQKESNNNTEQKKTTESMMFVFNIVLTFSMLAIFSLGTGATAVYMSVMTLMTTIASMYREIRSANARKIIRERAYVTISDFRLIHSALIEEYQHIDHCLNEIEKITPSLAPEVAESALAELDTERLATLLDRAAFWRTECYLKMSLDPEYGGPTDQEMARSAYTDRREAQELREQLSRARDALLGENASFAEKADVSPEALAIQNAPVSDIT